MQVLDVPVLTSDIDPDADPWVPSKLVWPLLEWTRSRSRLVPSWCPAAAGVPRANVTAFSGGGGASGSFTQTSGTYTVGTPTTGAGGERPT